MYQPQSSEEGALRKGSGLVSQPATSFEAPSPRGGGSLEALQEALLFQMLDLGLHIGLLEVGLYLLYSVRERIRGLLRFGLRVLTINIDDCAE
jgi:hypothetical protein